MARQVSSERTVKNWLAEVGGPSGEHLVDLIRRSDSGLETVLAMAGRRHAARAQRLLKVRKALLETVDQIDRSLGNAQG